MHEHSSGVTIVCDRDGNSATVDSNCNVSIATNNNVRFCNRS